MTTPGHDQDPAADPQTHLDTDPVNDPAADPAHESADHAGSTEVDLGGDPVDDA